MVWYSKNKFFPIPVNAKCRKRFLNWQTWWLDFYADFVLCLQHRNIFNSSDTVWKIGWDWLDKLVKDKIAFQNNLHLMFDSLQIWAFLSIITHLGTFRFCGAFYSTEILVCQDYDIADDVSKQKINKFCTILLILQSLISRRDLNWWRISN